MAHGQIKTRVTSIAGGLATGLSSELGTFMGTCEVAFQPMLAARNRMPADSGRWATSIGNSLLNSNKNGQALPRVETVSITAVAGVRATEFEFLSGGDTPARPPIRQQANSFDIPVVTPKNRFTVPPQLYRPAIPTADDSRVEGARGCWIRLSRGTVSDVYLYGAYRALVSCRR